MKTSFFQKEYWLIVLIIFFSNSCQNALRLYSKIPAKYDCNHELKSAYGYRFHGVELCKQNDSYCSIAFLENDEKAIVRRDSASNAKRLFALSQRINLASNRSLNRGKSISRSRPRYAYRLVIIGDGLTKEFRFDKDFNLIGMEEMTLAEINFIKNYFFPEDRINNNRSSILFQSVATVDPENVVLIEKICSSFSTAKFGHFVDGSVLFRVYVEVSQHTKAILLLDQIK